jgi:class 3 adenylate cyclase/tetratricopeptide (TPR) repeat protein
MITHPQGPLMQHIANWLQKLGLGQYAQRFAENDIDLAIVRDLTDRDLEKIGVASLGHRRQLLHAIAELRSISAPLASPKIAERRQVTVMFSDLVGSTALSARMDPEDLREVIFDYQKCVAATVRRFDGFVAKYMGDGVLVYFGYPEAHENDAERAVRAGLELAAALTALNTRVSLQTRVGIATGLVVVGDLVGSGEAQERGIIGETPNLAARLQGVAEPNTVVIAESTRKLLGNLFELQELGKKELKGIPAPVHIWRARRASSVSSRFEALHAIRLSAFLGREHELEVLRRGLERARSGLCVIDLVAEPGMGKSRLMYEFRRRISQERAFVVSGSCSPDGQKTPFLPFIEVVRASFRVNVGEAEKDVAQKLEIGLTALGLYSARNLGLLLNLLGLRVRDDVLAGLDGVLIGLRTRDLFQQMLEARCRLSPMVMVIEDLHWIDSASEELLGKIIDSEAKLRLLLLATRRQEYSPSWLNRPVVTELKLQPLPSGDIHRLLQARLGLGALPEALARQVTEKAEGNPLFAEEIVSYLTERGVLRAVAGKVEFQASAAAATLPASLQSLLTARVDRLVLTDRSLLQAASVIGRRFDPDLLAGAVGETDIDDRLAALQASDLVHRESKSADYVFKHALIRDALYQSLLTDARKSMHLKIAEEIERRSGNRLTEVAEALAHHYSQTDRADKAFAYLSMAGSKGLMVYSVDEASAYFAAALVLLDKNPDCSTDDQVAEFIEQYALFLTINGPMSANIDLLERYLPRVDRLGDHPRALLIRHYYALALLYSGRNKEAAAVQRELLPMAERLGDSRSMAYALATEIFVSTHVAPKPLNEFEILKRKATAAASEVTEAGIQTLVRYVIGWEEMLRGRMNAARASVHDLMQVGQVLNDPRCTGLGLWLLSFIALLSDSYAEALAYSEQCLAVALTEQDRLIALGAKAGALVLLRQPEEGAPLLEQYRQRCVTDGFIYALRGSDAIVGLHEVLQGNIKEGIRFIEEAILQAEKRGNPSIADSYRSTLAEVYLQIIIGSEKPPFPVLLKNLPILLKVKLSASARIRALIAHVLENPRFDPSGHHIGRAKMILGLLYKAKKKRTLAVKHLVEAKRIFSQFGQTPILTRVETALAELGQ